MATDSDDLKDAREEFQCIADFEDKNRKNWIDDIRFARLSEQWPDDVRRQRELEMRPCLTINRLPSFIRQVTNDARQNRPAITCHPVDSQADPETAEILNGLIRNIEYTSNADVAYDTALDHSVSGGFGYFRISTEYADDDVFEQDIKIERIVDPLSVYGDEESTSADSSDWKKAFVTNKWSLKDFEKKYPGAETSDFDAGRSDTVQWFGSDDIQIAEWWKRTEIPMKLLKLSNGTIMFEPDFEKLKDFFDQEQITVTGERDSKTMKVTQKIITGAEVLETNDWAGKYIPIVPVYGDEIFVGGDRHFISLIRFAKDPQRMFNYWRTASTELVALAPKTPFIGPVGAFNTDAAKWATANTQSHSFIEYDTTGGGAPQRQSFAGPPAGALQEALNAADDMKSIMGIFDASLGAKSNETSGRAILARQREGDVSTFNFIDNLSRAIRHAGRILVDLIPKVYSEARIIRVIGQDGTNEHVQINKPFTPQPDPNDQEENQEELQGIEKLYDLTTGKYDVTCEAGPSYTTKREEAATQMIEFMRSVPSAGQVMGDLVAKNLDWPGADDIAERLKSLLPPPAQGQNPQVMQLQQQIQQMGKQLDAMHADKSLEARKLDIDDKNADTNRMKVEAASMTPEQMQIMIVQTLQSMLSGQPMSAPQISPQGPQMQWPPPGMQPMNGALPMAPQQNQPPPGGMQPGA